DNSVFNQFKIGFCNGTIHKTIPESGEIVDILKQSGILTIDNQEYFKDCLVFPVFNQAENVNVVYGKSTSDNGVRAIRIQEDGLNIFNWQITYSEDALIIPEDIIDCLLLYQAGLKNTVFFNQLGSEDIKLLEEQNIREMYFLGSDPPNGGAREMLAAVQRIGIKGYAVNLTQPLPGLLKQSGAEGIEELLEATKLKSEKLKVTSELRQETEPKVISALSETDEIEGGFVVHFNRRRYELRGISKPTPRNLKTNIKVMVNSNTTSINPRFYIDTLDLYQARCRKNFIQGVSVFFEEEPEIIEKDVIRLINLSEDYLKQKKECKQSNVYVMSDMEKAEALRLLKSRNLVKIILKDMELLGYAGEESNKLMGYLCCISRKMEEPLSIMVISRSGAGKSSLAEVSTLLIPPKDLIKYTKLTGQALFYKDKESLKNKVLFIEEEKGAEEADYSIRTMQSARVLTIATTYRDTGTGKLRTAEYEVQGPLSVILTTTRTDIDYDMMSRFITLSIDESNEQTKRIQEVQRQAETLEGLHNGLMRQNLIKKHQNIQRLLNPVKVINPYAPYLTFIDDRLRARRDHKKYLNLIKTIAFLYQYQRPVKETMLKETKDAFSYIEVTIDDIHLANQLAHDVLGKSLDELTQPSRELLLLVYEMVREKAREEKMQVSEFVFTRRQIREYTHWSHYQASKHIRELEEKEYLLPRRPGMDMTKRYRLLYSGEGLDGSKFMPGLVSLEVLRQKVGTGR
ncbi:MAG: hypothetical protein QME51_08855, partial [Planctomycetota bacterium]|nr:hypothetical protein [Planctomycetota bacterium]